MTAVEAQRNGRAARRPRPRSAPASHVLPCPPCPRRAGSRRALASPMPTTSSEAASGEIKHVSRCRAGSAALSCRRWNWRRSAPAGDRPSAPVCSASRWITSSGLAENLRVRPPSSETKLHPLSWARWAMKSIEAASVRPWPSADRWTLVLAAVERALQDITGACGAKHPQRQGAVVPLRHDFAIAPDQSGALRAPSSRSDTAGHRSPSTNNADPGRRASPWRSADAPWCWRHSALRQPRLVSVLRRSRATQRVPRASLPHPWGLVPDERHRSL